mmetsp:Transcript_49986/g.159973  ORF Transcript_49986/g.159973 Transcript_49986/m.159973 type:complete len:116 (-) Transcript_49986:230-577(-)
MVVKAVLSLPSTIYVASKNPVKVRSVVDAFKRVFPAQTFTFEGIDAPSNEPDQPDEETLRGYVALGLVTRKSSPSSADGTRPAGKAGKQLLPGARAGVYAWSLVCVVPYEGRWGG